MTSVLLKVVRLTSSGIAVLTGLSCASVPGETVPAAEVCLRRVSAIATTQQARVPRPAAASEGEAAPSSPEDVAFDSRHLLRVVQSAPPGCVTSGPAEQQEIEVALHPAEQSVMELSFAACIRELSSGVPERVAQGANVARVGTGYALTTPWLLDAFRRAPSQREAILTALALASLRSRSLLPMIMGLPEAERRELLSLPGLVSSVFGDVAFERIPSGTRFDWPAWWLRNSSRYWAEDFRDWSEPNADQGPALYPLALGFSGAPFEAQAVLGVDRKRRLYLADFWKVGVVDLGSGRVRVTEPLRSVLALRSAGERGTHAVPAAVYDAGDEVWLRFHAPWGLAVLDSELGLKRYHRTDKEAIEREYGKLVRLFPNIRIWPVDDVGRVWQYVESVRGIRVYDGRTWEPLDLRPAATRTAELLARLGCRDEGIVAYQREFVQATWLTQTVNGAIYVGTSEGIIVRACANGRYVHLNALQSPLLGYKSVDLMGEGQPGDLWVSCVDDASAGIVRLRPPWDQPDVFVVSPGVLPGRQPVPDRLGRTWFAPGFGAGGAAICTGERWYQLPGPDRGRLSVRGLCVTDDGQAWICSEKLVGRADEKGVRWLAPPRQPAVGAVINGKDSVLLVTPRGVWALVGDSWTCRAAW